MLANKLKRELRNFLLVIVLGVISAFVVTYFFIHQFGATGRYQVKNALLSPATIPDLNYNDYNPKTSAFDRYVFMQVEFEYFSPEQNQWVRQKLDLDTYAKIYQLIEKDQSVDPVTEEQTSQYSVQPARLVISVKTESDAKWQEDVKVFQTVEFAQKGNGYRVGLHEDNPGVQWAYFEHPGIYQKILELLTKNITH